MSRVGAFVDGLVVGHRAPVVGHAVVHFVLLPVRWSNSLVTTGERSGFRSRGHGGGRVGRGCTRSRKHSAARGFQLAGATACNWTDAAKDVTTNEEREVMAKAGSMPAGVFQQVLKACHLARDKSHDKGPATVQIAALNSSNTGRLDFSN